MTSNLNLTCPCGMSLLNPRAANLIASDPRNGDIIICGACNCPNVVTPTGARYITDTEFRALHPDERRDLDFAMRALKKQITHS